MKEKKEKTYSFPKLDLKQLNGVYVEPFSKNFKITINDGKYVNTEDYGPSLQYSDEGDVTFGEDGQIVFQQYRSESIISGKKEVEESHSKISMGFFYNDEIIEPVDSSILDDGTVQITIKLYDKSEMVYAFNNGTVIMDKVTKKLFSKKHDKKERKYEQTMDHMIIDDEEDGIIFMKYGQDYFQVIYKKEK